MISHMSESQGPKLGMNAGEASPQALSFSTRNLPEKERVPYWREVFGRHVIRVDFTPQSDARFEADASLLSVPGLRAHWSVYKGAAQLRRTKDLISKPTKMSRF